LPPAVRCCATMAASDRTARPKAAFVYMVRCAGGQLYTGWTNDPAARLRAHQSGKGARYTRAKGAAALAYVERCADKPAALRREAALKKLPKAQKERLCAAWAAAGRPFAGETE
jgi:putative endonuclease